MLKEFKEFAMRGNVMDLAVGVIIGGAFGKIVASLVGDIFMPIIGVLMGGVSFADLYFEFGKAQVFWGKFVQNIVDFVIIALIVFLIVRAMNYARKAEPVPAPAAPTTKDCPYCLSAIPLKATRCPNCTSQL